MQNNANKAVTCDHDAERRSGKRHTLVLRVAVVDDGKRASFCLLKNISPDGVQVKSYAPLEIGAMVTLFVGEDKPDRPGCLVSRPPVRHQVRAATLSGRAPSGRAEDLRGTAARLATPAYRSCRKVKDPWTGLPWHAARYLGVGSQAEDQDGGSGIGGSALGIAGPAAD